MNNTTRRNFSMAKRAADFAAAHPIADPAFSPVLERLRARVAQADAIAMQEGDGQRDEHAGRTRRRELGRSIRRTYMTLLVATAKEAETAHPELVEKFVMPAPNMATKPFLTAARSMLVEATARQDVLAPLGLGEQFIKDFTQAVNDLGGTTDAVHSGRDGHIEAGYTLQQLVRDIRRDITALGALYKLPGNLALYAAWTTARTVPGPFTHHPDAGVEPAPAPAPVAPPATGTA